jgi:uncharacterized protein YcbK (DUF882 family)
MNSIGELNKRKFKITPEIEANLKVLFYRLMLLQTDFGKDLVITSGLRSQAFQYDLIQNGKSKAKKSNHILGAAADILDSDGSLAKWIQENIVKMEEIGFWMESFTHTKGWVHVQIFPPKSGKRVFIP